MRVHDRSDAVRSRTTRAGRGAGLAALATVAATIAGCQGGLDVAKGPAIRLDAFRSDAGGLGGELGGDDAVATVDPAMVDAAGPAGDAAANVTGPSAMDHPLGPPSGANGPRVNDVVARASGPAAEPEAGTRYVVDEMVGQVHGRPIFADAFFEPIEDQLIAFGRSGTQGEFIRQADQLIATKLQRDITNSLFLAEAEASLSAEERQGLRFWLQDLTSRVAAGSGRSREEADARLRATRNLSLEEYVQYQRDAGLIQKLITEEISPRIVVSTRDIEREYRQRYAEFNPPPRVTLTRIRVRATDADRLADVTARLDGGEAFDDVARDVMGESRMVFDTYEVEPAELSTLEWPEAMQDAIGALQALGATAGPIELGRNVMWMHVSSVEREPGRTLFDVQRQLETDIRGRRFAEEERALMARLFSEGILDDRDEMRNRLLVIAITRYYRPGTG